MNSATYEFETTRNTLETYEWDRMWIDHPYDTDSKRILYIGDSISEGIRKIMPKMEENRFLWDAFATSKGADNPCFSEMLRLFRQQTPNCDVLLFNNGLHGWHLDDETEYPDAYEKILNVLRAEWSESVIVPVLTTCLADSERNTRVKRRNEAARSIAAKYQLPVLDLYSVAESHATLMIDDGVHFSPEGYEALAQEILAFLRDLPALEQ
jgi:hypothetical protein